MGESRNAEASRQRILEAAETIFAAEGYSGARVDAIADRAGINKRMLYHYFGDKKGLYQAVLQRMVDRLIQKMQPALQQNQTAEPEAGLRALIGAYFDMIRDEPNYVRLAIHEAAHGWQAQEAIQNEPQASDPDLDGFEDQFSEILILLQQGVTQGRFRNNVDPRLVISMATLFCRLYILLLPRFAVYLGRPIDSPEQLAWAREQFIELFLYGIISRPEGPAEKGVRNDQPNSEEPVTP